LNAANPMMSMLDVDTLLAQLNEWEQKYGPLGGGKGLASSGEAPARIAELKRQLSELGIVVEWNGTEYVIVSRNDGGGGRR
jgi:hypothetical protein